MRCEAKLCSTSILVNITTPAKPVEQIDGKTNGQTGHMHCLNDHYIRVKDGQSLHKKKTTLECSYKVHICLYIFSLFQ